MLTETERACVTQAAENAEAALAQKQVAAAQAGAILVLRALADKRVMGPAWVKACNVLRQMDQQGQAALDRRLP